MASEVAAYCRSVADGTYRSAVLIALPEHEVSLRERLPPVAEQSASATCTAHAVAVLVAYAENPTCPPVLSVQFLFDRVKFRETEWISRNLESIRCGLEPDGEFALVYSRPYARLKQLIEANGGVGSAAARSFLAQFESQLQARTGVSVGSMIHRCFDVVRDVGVCRDELCPSASIQRLSLAGAAGRSEPSREVLSDASRHRVARGLKVLDHPNSVNEIRRILSGAGGMMPMPVCVAVDIFEGCVNGDFGFPSVGDDDWTANRPMGLHAVLLVGFADDATEPGGGHFVVRNSWGSAWGDAGYGRMSYAYLEVFCREAGTILRQRNPAADILPIGSSRMAGGVCAVCGKSYHGGTSLRFQCEEPGCEAHICFDCHERKKMRRCQKHALDMPKTA